MREPRESALPRLVLAPLDAPELIYERLQEPSEQSPILYRERAYLVDGLQTDEDLEDQLETELSMIRRDWSHRNDSQFVHLALFDHSFQDEPDSPPIATLSWKDWQGKPELWVRGVRRFSAPPRVGLEPRAASGLLELDDAEVESAENNDSEPIPLVARARQAQRPLRTEPPISDTASLEPESPLLIDSPDPRPPDSGPGWQSPEKSGEYLIPLDEAAAPPPSSERVLAGEEMIGALFERMHELSYLPDIATGAAYVLETVEEFIPCNAALIHVFDIDTREFVVVRALGPHSRDVLMRRTSGGGSHLEDALRRQTTVQLSAPSQPLWRALGVEPEHVLCGPVHQNGRYLGAIELAREAERGSFNDGQVSALEYICEQFADFVADRPLELTAQSILPPPILS